MRRTYRPREVYDRTALVAFSGLTRAAPGVSRELSQAIHDTREKSRYRTFTYGSATRPLAPRQHNALAVAASARPHAESRLPERNTYTPTRPSPHQRQRDLSRARSGQEGPPEFLAGVYTAQ